MTSEIRIGLKPVMICGNAATPIRYKQVFHEDLLKAVGRMTPEDFDVVTLMQLAFIMNRQAEGADFRAVTFDMFCEWLEQFEQDEFLEKVGEILNLWIRTSQTSVASKKNRNRPTGS